MNENKYISIRIDHNLLQKLHYISKQEDRSANGQITFLVNSCIRNFEEKHGKIEPSQRADQ